MKLKIFLVFLILYFPTSSNSNESIEIATGIMKSEDANVVVFAVTDDNPQLLDALEKHFAKVGVNPNDPALPCAYCSPELGMHKFKIPNDNPRLILEVEYIVRKYVY